MTRCAPRPDERVQIERHGRDQRLAFTGRHLGDLALVQRDAADQLHVVGHHVPGHGLAGHHDRCAQQTTAGFFYRGVGFGQDFIEDRLELFLEVLFYGQDPLAEAGTFFGVLGLTFGQAQFSQFPVEFSRPLLDDAAQLVGLSAQLIVGERLQFLDDLVYFNDLGRELASFAFVS